MKNTLTIVILLSSFVAFAQRNYLSGVVKDSLSGQDMLGVHVRNINAGSLATTDEYGRFKLPVQSGDTLLYSSIGYETLQWVLDSTWQTETEVHIFLNSSTVFLDEVVIGDFPKYERFKEMIMEAQPKDTSLQMFGVKPVVVTGDPRLNESYIKNPLFAVFHPIDFVYQNFSKREKEKRKHHQLVQNKYVTDEVNAKFTREWVAEMTELDGDKLTSFIAYCNFGTNYLAKTPLYMIHERMVELMPGFLKGYEDDN